MNRRSSLLTLLLIPILLLGQLPVHARPKNVLFIISDDLTATALSCYGNTQCKTPNVDTLASEGLRFNRAYCQFPVCGPSRAALMSGMYPQSIGVVGNGSADRFGEILGERPSVSQWFMKQGYYAARVSKIYHMRVPGDITAGVDGPDHAASWTERFNCRGPEWMTVGDHRHLTNGTLEYDQDKHYGLGFGTAFYVVKGRSEGAEQADYKAATKAIEIMENHVETPFFLAVGLVRPHVPLVAPQSFFKAYPDPEMKLVEEHPNDQADIPKAGISMTSEKNGLAGSTFKQRQVLSAYYASVAFMDAQVGRILDALRRLELEKDTIVVFTSDHGYHLGEHGFWQKMSLHEESVRIPLIISVPGSRVGVTESLAQQIDLYPTLVELAGLKIPAHCQGKSLAGLLQDPKRAIHDYIYTFRGNGHLIRTRDRAYMSYHDGTRELYDMNKDPHQFVNLAEDPDYSNEAAKLENLLKAHLDHYRSAE